MPSQLSRRPGPDSPSIAGYRLGRRLGEGGMGIVHRAVRERDLLPVALKVARDRSPERCFALMREVKALALAGGGRVVNLIDHGTADGQPWIALELLHGPTLRQFSNELWAPYARERPQACITRVCVAHTRGATEPALTALSNPTRPPLAAGRLRTVAQVLDGLCASVDQLHARGLVHADLKPDNVILALGRPTLIDFSLCVLPGSELNLARRGGTAAYAAPEQVANLGVDTRSDLYALGVIAYELLTGACPFRGRTESVLHQQLAGKPLAPSAVVQGVQSGWDAALAELLSKQPRARESGFDRLRSLSRAQLTRAANPARSRRTAARSGGSRTTS